MPGSRQFDELAVFEQQTFSALTDAYGNNTETWPELLSEWCLFRETPGRERVQAGAMEATATATLLIRYSAAAATLTARDRVTVRGTTWQIKSAPIQRTGRPKLLEFIVERGGVN